MMRLLALAPLLCFACNFNGSTDATGQAGDADPSLPDADPNLPDADPNLPDAAPPADAVTSCTPGETVCSGDRLETCNPQGTGIVPGDTKVCEFACVDDDRCLATSNLSGVDTDLCDQPGANYALNPQGAAEITVESNGSTTQLRCAPHCGDGVTTTIPAAAIVTTNVPNIAMFCLSSIDLSPTSSFKATSNVPHAIALIVESTATIAGNIEFSGGKYSITQGLDTRGPAGPGGGRGAAVSLGTIVNGEGACPGQGGETDGAADDHVGGGGGGGGTWGNGGNGGRGQSGNNGDTANGGAGGASCGVSQELVPLRAGSGGGSGGDGRELLPSGSPGGGGGGALQISARDFIMLSANITSNGGDGYGPSFAVDQNAGGGGGGSGGAILLESRTVTISGVLSVQGGDGGDGGSGTGANGASGGNVNGSNGTNENGSNESGAGAGGGAGRIRINGDSASCPSVNPSSTCSTGAMPEH